MVVFCLSFMQAMYVLFRLPVMQAMEIQMYLSACMRMSVTGPSVSRTR